MKKLANGLKVGDACLISGSYRPVRLLSIRDERKATPEGNCEVQDIFDAEIVYKVNGVELITIEDASKESIRIQYFVEVAARNQQK